MTKRIYRNGDSIVSIIKHNVYGWVINGAVVSTHKYLKDAIKFIKCLGFRVDHNESNN